MDDFFWVWVEWIYHGGHGKLGYYGAHTNRWIGRSWFVIRPSEAFELRITERLNCDGRFKLGWAVRVLPRRARKAELLRCSYKSVNRSFVVRHSSIRSVWTANHRTTELRWTIFLGWNYKRSMKFCSQNKPKKTGAKKHYIVFNPLLGTNWLSCGIE